jgi:hypothetical protein
MLGIVLCTAITAGYGHMRPVAIVRPASIAPRPAAGYTALASVHRLLSVPDEAECEFKSADADERQKLDYERQCYRHTAIIMHDRLRRLQVSLRRMARQIDRCEGRLAALTD